MCVRPAAWRTAQEHQALYKAERVFLRSTEVGCGGRPDVVAHHASSRPPYPQVAVLVHTCGLSST